MTRNLNGVGNIMSDFVVTENRNGECLVLIGRINRTAHLLRELSGNDSPRPVDFPASVFQWFYLISFLQKKQMPAPVDTTESLSFLISKSINSKFGTKIAFFIKTRIFKLATIDKSARRI